MEDNWLMITYGCSTRQEPNQPNKKTFVTNNQKKNWLNFTNLFVFALKLPKKGNKKSIKIAENIAITPPNLLGIALKIA